jgi:hypothetical protein
LTQAELLLRRDAVDYARASIELEGLYLTDLRHIELNEMYARGEIELDEIGRYVDGLLKKEAMNSKEIALLEASLVEQRFKELRVNPAI